MHRKVGDTRRPDQRVPTYERHDVTLPRGALPARRLATLDVDEIDGDRLLITCARVRTTRCTRHERAQSWPRGSRCVTLLYRGRPTSVVRVMGLCGQDREQACGPLCTP